MIFGRWTVLSDSGRRWLCRCECGTEREVDAKELRRGGSKSCGCLNRELVAARASAMGKAGTAGRTTHGRSHTPEYNSWKAMRRRCLEPSFPHYGRYGGRGITIHPAWLDSFETFLADMGPRPKGHSLDRIDNDGNYEPANCRWADQKEQCRHLRGVTPKSAFKRRQG